MTSPMIILALAGALTGFAPTGNGSAPVIRASGDCSAAASQVVAETGGQLLSATPQGNECVITVLVPGSGDARPRKVTVRVPM